jgi:hypothetical protein
MVEAKGRKIEMEVARHRKSLEKKTNQHGSLMLPSESDSAVYVLSSTVISSGKTEEWEKVMSQGITARAKYSQLLGVFRHDDPVGKTQRSIEGGPLVPQTASSEKEKQLASVRVIRLWRHNSQAQRVIEANTTMCDPVFTEATSVALSLIKRKEEVIMKPLLQSPLQ